MRRRVEWPEVGTKDHDIKGDLHVIVVLLHPFLERIGEILTQAHVCNVHH